VVSNLEINSNIVANSSIFIQYPIITYKLEGVT